MLARYRLLTAALGHHQLGRNGIFVLSGNELMRFWGLLMELLGWGCFVFGRVVLSLWSYL